jgi:two-component system sensor histidine kinase EvgS
MKSPLRILHLEDNVNDAALVRATLETGGVVCSTHRVQTRTDFIAALERGGVDLVLSDFSLPSFDGMSALKIVRAQWPDVPLILVSGTLGEEVAIESLKSGATDYVLKEHLSRLVPAVRRAIQEVEARKERRRAEETLRQNERQLQVASEELKGANRSLLERNTEIQNFYHTLSHELKTPLTSAREFVSIVMDGLAGPLNKTQLEYLGIAKESCDQLRLYVNDLLDVTRLETGKMSLTLQTLPLAELLERVVTMLAPAAAGKGLTLDCDCQPDLPPVPVDKQRILQVLTNLTTNAIKFTPAGGQIHLSLGETVSEPHSLLVSVRDTGRGIPKNQLDLIFNRLHQANGDDASAESRSGLGLGLYICHELVHLHHGRLWVESEPGKGSTFSFVIPKEAVTKGAHVLIVDDESGTREVLRRLLEDENFEVTTAAEGNEALQLMRGQVPDVVVLDLRMPGLNGPETLKEIRKHWGLISVIVYTGYPDDELMVQVMDSSPFTLLAKPCPSKRFVDTVRRICHSNDTQFLKKKAGAGRVTGARKA